MAMHDRNELLAIVESWPVEERLAFAKEICDRIGAGEDLNLTDDFRAELDRRIAAYKTNPERAVPWEEVYAEAMTRVRL